MLRSVDGGGEVDLDKRAITGDDDIIELDQLPTQHTEPPSAHHDSHPAPAQAAEHIAAPRPPTGHAKPLRRIVVLSDETGSTDARHSDRPITAAPDQPTPAGIAPLPASGASPGSPEPASRPQRNHSRLLAAPRRTLRRRPRLATGAAILMLALTAAGAIALAAGSRDHRARSPRTTASGATIPTRTAPSIPHVAIDARQPTRARRTANRRQSHARRHHLSVTASAPATVAVTHESGRTSQPQTSSYTPASAVHSQSSPSERPPTTSGTQAPTHQQSSSTSGTSRQPSKTALKSLVTGAGTCGCQ
jgi:hypothetical protein